MSKAERLQEQTRVGECLVMEQDIHGEEPRETWSMVFPTGDAALAEINAKCQELIEDELLEPSAYAVYEGYSSDDSSDHVVSVYETEADEDSANAAWRFYLRPVVRAPDGR